MRLLVILGLLATGHCWFFSRRRQERPLGGSNSFTSRDLPCQRIHGDCQDISEHCDGIYQSGKCGGPITRKCCVHNHSPENARGSCDLVTYSSPYITGNRGLNVRVDREFVRSMDKIGRSASACGVTVRVTSAFRKDGQSLHGTVVPPAKKSNHLVGHAIDFNLSTPHGWCNSKCLQAKSYSSVRCFINRVKADGLRWGGDFSRRDPVHIDDGLNVRNVHHWNQLYVALQKNCD